MSNVVFILGASASRQCGAPLMADFLDVASDLLRANAVQEKRAEFERVFAAIGALQAVHSKAQLDLNNIESIFTVLELGRIIQRVPGLSAEEIPQVIAALKELIVRTLEVTMDFPVSDRHIGVPKPYEAFAKLLLHFYQDAFPSQTAAVISFNYDIAADMAMHRAGLGTDYIIEKLSSEKRLYLPVGIVSNGSVISNLAFAVYGAPEYLLSILSSRLHALWTAAIGGQLETRLRYSNTLVYNTFPIPDLSADQKTILEGNAIEIFGAREAHPGKTIAWLYDPETMPANLLQAHKDLDDALEQMYIGRPFKNDTERLEHLFKLYANMIKKEQAAKTAKQPKLISTGAA